MDLRAPTIQIPQNSESSNVLVVHLGDLSLKNYFEDSEVGGGVLQHWDHLYLRLDEFSLIRWVNILYDGHWILKVNKDQATQPFNH